MVLPKRGRLFASSCICLCLSFSGLASAKVIGMNTPATEISISRLKELPLSERKVWHEYIIQSQRQNIIDRNTLKAEQKPGVPIPPPPTAGSSKMPLEKESSWYSSIDALAIAENIISFQTPSGGWSKNQDRTKPPRLPGQRYSNNAETMEIGTGSFDAPRDRFWTFVGSFDNDATTTEIRFLAKVQAQIPFSDGQKYRDSILKGINYILMSQYPNGGWPQNYPLEGGFHDGITFNDNVVAKAASLLADIAEGDEEFKFVPEAIKQKASISSVRAIKLILKSQVIINSKRTVWPQQIDAISLEPISARNYEMRSLASAESADVLIFLMKQKNPSLEMKTAIHQGVLWLKEKAIYNKAFTKMSDEDGRKLIDKEGAGPIWSRNYDLKTGQPIFGDWGKTIHDDVNEISKGRRNGYSWYGSGPQKAINMYEVWKLNNK